MRALVFDAQGTLLAKRQVPIEPYFSTSPGRAEQHTHVFWDAVCQTCQELWGLEQVSKEALAGVALTTQRSTLVSVDAQGEPLRGLAIVWLNQRRTEGLTPLGGYGAWAFAQRE